MPARKSKQWAKQSWLRAKLTFFTTLFLATLLAADEVAITILHTSDVHGHVAEVWSNREQHSGSTGRSKSSFRWDKLSEGGGLLRCATLITEIRAREENVILVDCGDLFQGSPESFLTTNRIVAEAVRYLRYDALVTGNHEFDGGVGALRQFYSQAQTPVLAANIQAPPKEEALPGARDFLYRDFEGVRLAIVGLTTPLIPQWSRPRLLGNVTVEDSLKTLHRVMPQVRAVKPDILVLATHQALREWGDDQASQIHAIARAFPEFDLILGGHTHQAVESETVNGVAYTQAGYHALWLGSVRLVFDTKERRIKSKKSQLLPVDSGVAADKILSAKLAEPLQETEKYLSQEVGQTVVELEATSSFPGQSAIQTLIAAAIAEQVQAQVVIHRALTEASLRAGRIRMKDVWRIVPYDNYIGVAHLTLAELRQILEENSNFYDSDDFRGVYGLTYDLRPDGVVGARVANVRLTGRPAVTRERIRVAFNSYDLASAGGRLPRLRAIVERSASGLEEHLELNTRDAVLAYLREHRPLEIRPEPGAKIIRQKK